MSEVSETLPWYPTWTIEKYPNQDAYERGEAEEVSTFKGNLVLNVGAQALWNLVLGIAGPLAYSGANARLGVGDSSALAAQAQTGLQATTNATYLPMAVGFPNVSTGRIAQWAGVAGPTIANYAWNEFTVDNGTTSLNRCVNPQGTKAPGATWVLTLQISI